MVKLSDVISFCSEKITPTALEFLKHQLCHQKKIRRNTKIKEVSLCLYLTGILLYDFLCSIFKLPSMSTLKLFTNRIELKPGFLKSVLKQLEIKSSSMLPDDRKCILLADEISLKSGFQYKQKDDIIYGVDVLKKERILLLYSC